MNVTGRVTAMVDMFSRIRPKWNRARVLPQIMDEIGYEDCDWISHEVAWKFWTRFISPDVPVELHVPCRDPVDHIMSQCNHIGRGFTCAEKNLVEEVSRCIIQPGRFSLQLQNFRNLHLKCFDFRASFDGRYADFMATRLQRRRITERYIFRPTNQPRHHSSCLWRNRTFVEQLRDHLIASVEYYSFCSRCMISNDNIFKDSM